MLFQFRMCICRSKHALLMPKLDINLLRRVPLCVNLHSIALPLANIEPFFPKWTNKPCKVSVTLRPKTNNQIKINIYLYLILSINSECRNKSFEENQEKTLESKGL